MTDQPNFELEYENIITEWGKELKTIKTNLSKFALMGNYMNNLTAKDNKAMAQFLTQKKEQIKQRHLEMSLEGSALEHALEVIKKE